MPMHNKTIAIFGSAFNPPHLGHADVIQQTAIWADKIMTVPSYCHAFGKQMAPFDLRVRMTQALIRSLPDALIKHKTIEVSTIEQRLALANTQKKQPTNTPTPIYTFDVLTALALEYPNDTLKFVVGPDNADPMVWSRFYKSEEILATWGVWAAQERLGIRSRHIRELIYHHKQPSTAQCPLAVLDLIAQSQLYTQKERYPQDQN